MSKHRASQSAADLRFVPNKFVVGLAILIIAAVSSSVAAGTPAASNDPNAPDGGKYAIGLWGDLPYTTPTSDIQATVGVPNLIADMNSQKLAFTAHDGDLKAGSFRPCDDSLYTQGLAYLNALEAPAVFTPGDNDWTDCDRASNGGFNSLERLSHERQVFFSTPYTNGQQHLFQEVQATPLCLGVVNGVRGPEPCVENRRWNYHGVTYATINIQGSCNNLCDTNPDPDEWAARNAADIAWVQDTFAQAEANGSAAVMLITQADPGWDATDATRTSTRDPKTLAETDGLPDGFQAFLVALRNEVIAFRKPVAYVHGDSHYFRVDKPFLAANGQRLENFTRVETYGDNAPNGTNDVNWLKVYVDVNSREVFSYQPQIVPGNRTAVPTP
jgi:hypothetical protein